MPTRLIREGIISSDRIDQLDWAAEVFYRRLLNKVDDFGLYDGRPSILRANLYPLRVDRVREADISRWIAMCDTAGLIVLYEADEKPYLKVLDTRWKTRSEPKYPLPDENSCKQVKTVEPLYVVEDVDVVEDERNNVGQDARRIIAFLNEKAGRRYRENRVNLDFIKARLKDGATVTECRQVIVKKCREWKGDAKMELYLRPATLFNRTKFAQYQGELVAAPEDAPRETS